MYIEEYGKVGNKKTFAKLENNFKNTLGACKLVSLIENINKFKKVEHLASYAGIAACNKIKGKSAKDYINVVK